MSINGNEIDPHPRRTQNPQILQDPPGGGIEDCYLQADLGTLILKSIGLNDGKHETVYYYSDLMDKHAKKITADARSIKKQAMKVYKALVKR